MKTDNNKVWARRLSRVSLFTCDKQAGDKVQDGCLSNNIIKDRDWAIPH